MKNERIALIGCGRIGCLLEADPLRNKPCTHWGGASAAGLPINYACDINEERLRRFSEMAGIPPQHRFSSYETLITEVRPSMVIVSTWTDTHAAIGITAARHGAKVIVCEKPVAGNLADARALCAECEKHGAALIVNHERRYDGRYRAVKKMIDSGAIGVIKTVHASVLTSGFHGESKAAAGGGPLLHDGTHLIDIVRFFFGDITSVQGEFHREDRKKGFEDRATAWMTARGGIDVFIEAGGNRNYFVFELEISGTLGKIVIGNGYELLYRTEKSRHYTGFRDLSLKKFPPYSRRSCFTTEYIEAKKLLRGTPAAITSGGRDGYRALEAIHAIYLSASLHRKIIELPVNPDTIDIQGIFGLTQ